MDTPRQDPRSMLGTTLPWMIEGTEFLLAAVRRISDAELAGPSGLPGWTRGHVVGHVARNAEALARLAAWARTGVPTPMYASAEQRNTDIETSATQSPERLREDLAGTAEELDEALAWLGDRDWLATVRTAQGATIPATDLPWMRCREVWLHAVDLAADPVVTDLPAGLVDVLLTDVTGALSAAADCPVVDLVATDREHGWRLGSGAGTGAAAVTGTAAELVAWLTGRGSGAGLAPADGLPALPGWL